VSTPPTWDRPAPAPSIHASLVPEVSEHAANLPGSWFLTHGLGKPAALTYTEVAFSAEALIDPDGKPWPEHVLDRAVLEVAGQLYGRAYAFHYRPDQYADAIERHGLRRRERVIVTSIEVYL
jgi:hypothetical protein